MRVLSDIISTMLEMFIVFEPYCKDKDTIRKLYEMASSSNDKWREAKSLFLEIRQKTLKADKHQDKLASTQYLFEEACAKTLYNLTNPPAPFDADAPFRIISTALGFGRELGFTEPSQVSSLFRMRKLRD